jgi:hypothetical protein
LSPHDVLTAAQSRLRWLLAIRPADEDSPDELRFEVRPGARTAVRMMMVLCALACTLLAVVAVAGPDIEFPIRVLVFVVVAGMGALELLWLERRGIKARVVATPRGISVFNGLRTYFVPWSEVEGFQHSSRPFLLAVRRTKGRPLPMAGLTPGSFGDLVPQVEDLERLEGYWRRMTVVKVEIEDPTSTVRRD